MTPRLGRLQSPDGDRASKRAARMRLPPGKRPSPQISNQHALKMFGIHAKLSVSRPGEPDEQEADRLADDFMAGRTAGTLGNQQRLGAAGILRKCADCAEEESLPIMRQAGAGRLSSAPLISARGGGNALTPKVRAPLERFYRTDLSSVRVHTDAAAHQSAMSFGARAYAQGADLVFAPNEYAPHTEAGLRLLAHELAHVVQHTRRPDPHRIARTPNLSPDEMFAIITRERAFTFSPGGGQLCVDPQGVGRGVGAAAGGRQAGSAVFAVIQITDADGRPVALSYGEHVSYGDPHAEQRAVAGLNRTIPQVRDLTGGRMTVVVDQVPCPPGRANCMGTLQNFARQRGLQLEIHVPTRERVGGGGSVAPRTAAMSSMRTDTPPVSLRRYDTGGGVPPPTGTPGPAPPTAIATRGGPIRFVAPRAAPPGVLRAQASAMAALSRETQRTIRIAGRVQLALRGVGGLLTILGVIHTVRTAQQMAAHGTVLADAEAQADRVVDYGSEMENWAIETTNGVSQLDILQSITSASEREDVTALFDIDTALTDTYRPFYERADQFLEIATGLRARERALGVMVDFYRQMAQIPQGPSTAPNAEAFAMYISLERLQGRVNTAATHFEAAERQMRYYAERLEGYASTANDRAWALIFSRVAVAVAEAERERALEASIARERRLNEIHAELEAIEAELNQPVCRPPAELEPFLQRREALLGERALLQSPPSP